MKRFRLIRDLENASEQLEKIKSARSNAAKKAHNTRKQRREARAVDRRIPRKFDL